MTDPILKVKARIVRPPRAAAMVAYSKEPNLARTTVPHPCLSKSTASMHDDAYSSDASLFDGPYERDPSIRYFVNTTERFGGICAATAIDDQGRMLTMSFTRKRTVLLRMCPQTLAPLFSFEVPPRDVNIFDAIFRVGKIFKSTAGAYFCVDNHARVIVPTTKREIWVIAQCPDAPPESYFQLQHRIAADLPQDDGINCTLPVWDDTPHGPKDVAPGGYWFTSEGGRVGIARPAGQTQVKTISLPNGERINNGSTMSRHGLYLVTNRALYRLGLVGDTIEILRRAEYGTGPAKPGQPMSGSGTTPTLMDDRFVLIGDGAQVMNACVYHQENLELLDHAPVFGDQKGSACDNSFISVGSSFVVCNTYGYLNPMEMRGFEQSRGLVRFDVDALGKLTERWYRRDISTMSALPKLSIPRGVLYAYSMRWLEKPVRASKPQLDKKGKWEWSVVGLNFEDGKSVFKQPVFRGPFDRNQDNGWGTIALTPDGSLVTGMWRGLLRVGPA
jgi:hypothetical protein